MRLMTKKCVSTWIQASTLFIRTAVISAVIDITQIAIK